MFDVRPNLTTRMLNIVNNLLKKSRTAKFRVKYDEKEAQWTVFRSNRRIYVGDQSQCQHFIEINHDAYL